MWKWVERLLSGVSILLMLGWLVCAAGIATWIVNATGIELRRRGALALVLCIWLVPIGVVVALDEFVIRRIKYGPPAPGRRKRGPLDPGQPSALSEHRSGDASDG